MSSPKSEIVVFGPGNTWILESGESRLTIRGLVAHHADIGRNRKVFVTWDRLITLFASPFSSVSDRSWAMVSVATIVVFIVVTRPRLVLQARRSVPLVLALTGFLVLPETLAATWLIASRFCVYVHAFVPAVVKFHRTDWLRHRRRA
jgi:hypothetical protein